MSDDQLFRDIPELVRNLPRGLNMVIQEVPGAGYRIVDQSQGMSKFGATTKADEDGYDDDEEVDVKDTLDGISPDTTSIVATSKANGKSAFVRVFKDKSGQTMLNIGSKHTSMLIPINDGMTLDAIKQRINEIKATKPALELCCNIALTAIDTLYANRLLNSEHALWKNQTSIVGEYCDNKHMVLEKSDTPYIQWFAKAPPTPGTTPLETYEELARLGLRTVAATPISISTPDAVVEAKQDDQTQTFASIADAETALRQHKGTEGFVLHCYDAAGNEKVLKLKTIEYMVKRNARAALVNPNNTIDELTNPEFWKERLGTTHSVLKNILTKDVVDAYATKLCAFTRYAIGLSETLGLSLGQLLGTTHEHAIGMGKAWAAYHGNFELPLPPHRAILLRSVPGLGSSTAAQAVLEQHQSNEHLSRISGDFYSRPDMIQLPTKAKGEAAYTLDELQQRVPANADALPILIWTEHVPVEKKKGKGKKGKNAGKKQTEPATREVCFAFVSDISGCAIIETKLGRSDLIAQNTSSKNSSTDEETALQESAEATKKHHQKLLTAIAKGTVRQDRMAGMSKQQIFRPATLAINPYSDNPSHLNGTKTVGMALAHASQQTPEAVYLDESCNPTLNTLHLRGLASMGLNPVYIEPRELNPENTKALRRYMYQRYVAAMTTLNANDALGLPDAVNESELATLSQTPVPQALADVGVTSLNMAAAAQLSKAAALEAGISEADYAIVNSLSNNVDVTFMDSLSAAVESDTGEEVKSDEVQAQQTKAELFYHLQQLSVLSRQAHQTMSRETLSPTKQLIVLNNFLWQYWQPNNRQSFKAQDHSINYYTLDDQAEAGAREQQSSIAKAQQLVGTLTQSTVEDSKIQEARELLAQWRKTPTQMAEQIEAVIDRMPGLRAAVGSTAATLESKSEPTARGTLQLPKGVGAAADAAAATLAAARGDAASPDTDALSDGSGSHFGSCASTLHKAMAELPAEVAAAAASRPESARTG